MPEIPVVISDQAFDELGRCARESGPAPVLLVADDHTFAAAGRLLQSALEHQGLESRSVLLNGAPRVAADEVSITRVLAALDGKQHLLVALGSGTITDITRFVAYQARLPYLSAPTAASVDAFTSFTASITIQQLKYSLPTKQAAGVFAHLPTLCAAPAAMTAAGYGDVLAKLTALADWQIAHLLTGESCDPAIRDLAAGAARACVTQAEAIGTRRAEGIATLANSLMVSGTCMVRAGSSRPAAGAEHSLSHFWEITHARRSLPESLHGEKTGVASVIIARLYQSLRGLSRDKAARRLKDFRPPEPAVEAARLEQIFGDAASHILAARPSFLGKLSAQVEEVGASLLAHWDEVQQIAAQVPPAEELSALLALGGAPNRPEQIHVTPQEVSEAIQFAMYLRDRLTILELNRLLRLSEDQGERSLCS